MLNGKTFQRLETFNEKWDGSVRGTTCWSSPSILNSFIVLLEVSSLISSVYLFVCFLLSEQFLVLPPKDYVNPIQITESIPQPIVLKLFVNGYMKSPGPKFMTSVLKINNFWKHYKKLYVWHRLKYMHLDTQLTVLCFHIVSIFIRVFEAFL